jgi:pimeloyl-ACP methyl ester carboxylesterase
MTAPNPANFVIPANLVMLCRILIAALSLAAFAAAADDELPKSRTEALAIEAKDALPLTSFYDPPATLDAAPGALIRSQPFHGYSLPRGARAVRILYVSSAPDGTPVAASGVVLIPSGSAPRKGWPVIAWAHGTSGVARMCAPSLMKDVEYGSEGLMPMVAAGFAVVATDYAGLGTPGPHRYDNKLAQANDVLYSIPAARAAVPSLGQRWVAIGHSQGGVAVWGLAELEAKLDDANYRGAISVAGDMSYEIFEAHDAQSFEIITNMYWPFTAFGIKASYPSFDVAQMLSPAMLERYEDVTTKGCWYYGYAAAVEMGHQAAVRPGWNKAPELARYNEDSRSADKPIRGPLMVLAGDDDTSVNFANIQAGVAEACRNQLPIEFVHSPGLDHDPLMEKTIGMQLKWVRARLTGKPWKGNCNSGQLSFQSLPRDAEQARTQRQDGP